MKEEEKLRVSESLAWGHSETGNSGSAFVALGLGIVQEDCYKELVARCMKSCSPTHLPTTSTWHLNLSIQSLSMPDPIPDSGHFKLYSQSLGSP